MTTAKAYDMQTHITIIYDLEVHCQMAKNMVLKITFFQGAPNLLYVVAMLVATAFLFLTILVYAILWKRQNVHGWTFMGYLASLLFTFIFLSTAHLATGEYDCTFVGKYGVA